MRWETGRPVRPSVTARGGRGAGRATGQHWSRQTGCGSVNGSQIAAVDFHAFNKGLRDVDVGADLDGGGLDVVVDVDEGRGAQAEAAQGQGGGGSPGKSGETGGNGTAGGGGGLLVKRQCFDLAQFLSVRRTSLGEERQQPSC